MEKRKVKIKVGKNNGIAVQVQGQIVEVEPHPTHKGMYRFLYGNEFWICSDYAFDTNMES